MPEYKKISITLPADLVDQMRSRRDELSGAVRVSLERYLDCMARERAGLRKLLSDEELGLILDTLNGIAMLDTHSVAFIPHEIADAISLDQYDQKWKVDSPALLEKMNAMSYAQRMALADAAERWWNRIGRGERPQPEISEALK